MVMKRIFGTGIMLAMLLATFAAFAQEETDALEPAVDVSAVDTREADAPQPEDIDPAVETSAGNDTTRSTTSAGVMDSIQLGRTEITGNQQLPKVMYIVPWQKADPSDLIGRPVNTLLDEVLAPIDREEFVRQVDYYQGLYSDSERD